MSEVQKRKASLDAEIRDCKDRLADTAREWNEANSQSHSCAQIGDTDGVIRWRAIRQSAQDTRAGLESRIKALEAERDRL
jgi:hypothetical protein